MPIYLLFIAALSQVCRNVAVTTFNHQSQNVALHLGSDEKARNNNWRHSTPRVRQHRKTGNTGWGKIKQRHKSTAEY